MIGSTPSLGIAISISKVLPKASGAAAFELISVITRANAAAVSPP